MEISRYVVIGPVTFFTSAGKGQGDRIYKETAHSLSAAILRDARLEAGSSG
jgi:hypothetical protein